MENNLQKQTASQNAITPVQEKAQVKRPRRRRAITLLRIVSICIVAGIAYMYSDEILTALGKSLDIGWWFLALFPLFAFWNWTALKGWKALLLATPRESVPSEKRLFVIRTEAQALNLVLPLASIGGEFLKSVLTATDEGQKSSAPSVILDKIAAIASEILFVIVGAALCVSLLPFDRYVIICSAASAFLILIILFLWQKIFQTISRIIIFSGDSTTGKIVELLALNKEFHIPMLKAIVWHFAERILMAVEIFIIANALGCPIGIGETLFASALTTAFTLVMFFMPGQLGAFEGGLTYGFLLLGLPPTTGLTVALIRRGRQLVICIVGLALLFISEKHLRFGTGAKMEISPDDNQGVKL